MNSNDLKIISKKYKFDQLNQKIKNKLLTIDDYVKSKITIIIHMFFCVKLNLIKMYLTI